MTASDAGWSTGVDKGNRQAAVTYAAGKHDNRLSSMDSSVDLATLVLSGTVWRTFHFATVFWFLASALRLS